MSKVCQPYATCSPSQHDNSYIYTIIPVTGNGLAAITSSDELVLLDRQNLGGSSIFRLSDVPQRVSCLVPSDDSGNTVICAGGDGVVSMFDVRSQARVSHFQIDRAVTALGYADNMIALGTEFSHHQAIVSLWDVRHRQQFWQNAENNDDITALDFHPTKTNLVLAGGDDGQVSIFDTKVVEEDDSLLQGVNHGPIHKAGFLGGDRFYALSSDQNLSVHPVSSPDDTEDPLPTLLGDLRPLLSCQYVIDIFQSGDGYVVAAGSNHDENPQAVIVELRHATNLSKEPKLKTKSGYILEKAHGEEVVRSIFADTTTGTIFTAGEDGLVKAFRPVETTNTPPGSAKASKPKKSSEGRYKPY